MLHFVNMKRSILLVLSCAMAMVLVLGSCKSKTENVTESKEAEKTECATKEIKTLGDAIDAMVAYCKDGNKDAVLATYETMLRLTYEKTIENLTSGKAMDDVLTEEENKKMESLEGDCNCVSDEEMEALAEKIQLEYEPKMEAALSKVYGAIGEMNEASE